MAKRVLVPPVENKAKIDSNSILYLTDMIRNVAHAELPSDRFMIMDRQQMELLLPPGKSWEDCVGECAVDTAIQVKAHFVVTGSLYPFGKSFRFNIRVHDTKTKQRVGEPVVLKGTDIESLEEGMTNKLGRLFETVRNLSLGRRSLSPFPMPGVVKAGDDSWMKSDARAFWLLIPCRLVLK